MVSPIHTSYILTDAMVSKLHTSWEHMRTPRQVPIEVPIGEKEDQAWYRHWGKHFAAAWTTFVETCDYNSLWINLTALELDTLTRSVAYRAWCREEARRVSMDTSHLLYILIRRRVLRVLACATDRTVDELDTDITVQSWDPPAHHHLVNQLLYNGRVPDHLAPQALEQLRAQYAPLFTCDPASVPDQNVTSPVANDHLPDPIGDAVEAAQIALARLRALGVPVRVTTLDLLRYTVVWEVEYKHGNSLVGRTANGTSPHNAVTALWEAVLALNPGEYVVIESAMGRRCYRWDMDAARWREFTAAEVAAGA